MLAASHGKIIHSVVDTDYRSLIPLSDAFGFAAGGKLTFTISNIAIYQQHKSDKLPDLKHLGFFLSPIEAETAMADLAEEETPGACILDSIKGNSLPTFSDSLIRQVIDGKSDKAEFDFTLENGGPFYLYFANCDQDTPVSFDMHIEVGGGVYAGLILNQTVERGGETSAICEGGVKFKSEAMPRLHGAHWYRCTTSTAGADVTTCQLERRNCPRSIG